MKKINFSIDVLPHIVAIIAFLLVTVFFFNPVFFDNKILEQGDIQQWEGSSKSLRDFRAQTGKEGLWTNSMFSGMPAYLVNVEWGNKVVGYLKKVLAFSLPHPIANIYLAFISYYIMLLTFGVRPYLAIAGAMAFGLSTFMMVGLSAGHSARIGSIALMPLVIAGIHLTFKGKHLLGFGLTTAGFALHLRENHVQITYYLAIIVFAYGIVWLIQAIKNKNVVPYLKTIGLLIPAAIIAIGTYVGPLWSVSEYTSYTIRGKSELASSAKAEPSNGLSKQYAFEYSNGVMEPITLLIPSIYGGNSTNFFVLDQESETYKALAGSSDPQTANQLANYTSAYWGPQGSGLAYYAGATIVFLFALGIAFAPRRYIWWLVPVSVLALFMSMGNYFASFNYFLFDYLPAYNKFRSPTFALFIIFFAMPLLGLLGLETLLQRGVDKVAKRKLLIVLASTGGLCLIVAIFSGMFSFTKAGEEQLPAWFLQALIEDRKDLLVADALRSFFFILITFSLIYFDLGKKISNLAFYGIIIALVVIDLVVVNKRFLTEDKFKRKRENTMFTATPADEEILKDKSNYRVYNLQNPLGEARTSYFHNSLGGYHGAKLRRYQDLFDSCLFNETNELITDAQQGKLNFSNYNVLNMLNAKYIVFGPQRDNIIPNPNANGNAWFVREIEKVSSPTEELQKVCTINTRATAVVDASKFEVPAIEFDSASTIELTDHKPNYIKYQSTSSAPGFAVFSEIYYEKGWKAFIDGKETPIIRANYVLRALNIPSGKHVVEFKFEPRSFLVGNKITTASSWIMLIVLLGSIGWSIKKNVLED